MSGISQPSRTERAIERGRVVARAVSACVRELVRNPVRLLVVATCVVLVAVAVPLLVGGGARLERAWRDWRHDTTVDQSWVRATGTLTAVRARDGLEFRVTYRDRRDHRNTARAHVDAPGDRWIPTRRPIRYDPRHPDRVELVGLAEPRPVGSALVAGAAIGSGVAALVMAVALWRRRKLLAVSAHPASALRIPLAVSGVILTLGLAAWAVGTVSLQGWSGVADRLGHGLSVVFGDLLGVAVPLVAFATGCLLTAWLARHRHHERHSGMLSEAHRLIDRAAGYVPSPEDLKVAGRVPPDGAQDGPTGSPHHAA